MKKILLIAIAILSFSTASAQDLDFTFNKQTYTIGKFHGNVTIKDNVLLVSYFKRSTDRRFSYKFPVKKLNHNSYVSFNGDNIVTITEHSVFISGVILPGLNGRTYDVEYYNK